MGAELALKGASTRSRVTPPPARQWEHFPQAAAISILLAAIACDVRVKDVLRATAGDKRPLVEVLLASPRDFSTAARVLFSGVMLAANGRSLKVDDRDLEKDVGRLFEIRNRIAHRGELPSVADARVCGNVVQRVFAWLATLP